MREAAVLLLKWSSRVLLVRKRCPSPSPWACDVALPGGRIRKGESIVETALREAWEEAWIHPQLVEVKGIRGPYETLRGGILVHVVEAEPKGPLDPTPRDEEVDAVFWLHLSHVKEPREVIHPVRGMVKGIKLPGGLILWGVTLRILQSLDRLV